MPKGVKWAVKLPIRSGKILKRGLREQFSYDVKRVIGWAENRSEPMDVFAIDLAERGVACRPRFSSGGGPSPDFGLGRSFGVRLIARGERAHRNKRSQRESQNSASCCLRVDLDSVFCEIRFLCNLM